ncbi:MAG: DUF2950 domain-containing protein [Verrucomicrobiota bacterium]
MKKIILLLLIAVACFAVALPARSVSAASAEKQAGDTASAASKKPHLFASPEDAVKALKAAVDADDLNALRDLFGPGIEQVVSGDKVQDAKELASFTTIMKEACELSKQGDSKVVLNLGNENWPFPIPLVKQADGQWYFDALAGREEIVNRRVGENELNAIEICRAYVGAQRQYASADHDGNGVLKYAQKIKSTPGKKDGLFWDAPENEEQSPFGPLVANANEEGYGKKSSAGTPEPYKGYFFKVIKTQGSSAPGGAYNYVINGNMIGGFALIAWPATFGQSGVMTFMVNQQGKIYQKSLGENTSELAKQIVAYNPDKTWTLVGDESNPPPSK